MAASSVELRDGRVATISDDPDRVDRSALWEFLSTEAYWGRWRERRDVEAQLDGAWRVVSARIGDRMVGFARAVSDGVSLAYLADVYVLDEVRGAGIGRAIVRLMIDDGPGAAFRWMLHTQDAHGLYLEFGFAPPTARSPARRRVKLLARCRDASCPLRGALRVRTWAEPAR
jgi:GNAT superfamily N-acetyltransferase